MLNEPTVDKLRALRLDTMAHAWLEQQKSADVARLAFDERFALLVDAEWLARENRRLGRLLKDAKLKLAAACVEDIDFPPRRQLDKATVRQLATCRWVHEHQNIVVTGATGTGKTFLACAFAQASCRICFSALYRRSARLFDELTLARAAGTYPRLLSRIARIDVLILDDWGLTPMRPDDRRDLNEILEDRYGSRSTIVTSQLLVNQWHDYLGEPMVADAILDRLLHNAHRLVLKGPSRRKEVASGS
jgi:DNA replication protein DnaC